MGWRPEEGFYQRHVKEEGFSNKITEEQEKFNKLKPEQIREGISIVTKQVAKENGNVLHEEINSSKEPIEYVVEEVKEQEEVDR